MGNNKWRSVKKRRKYVAKQQKNLPQIAEVITMASVVVEAPDVAVEEAEETMVETPSAEEE